MSTKRRRRVIQTQSLEDRLAQVANRLRNETKAMKPGPDREILLRRARQAELAAEMSEWLRSPDRQKVQDGLIMAGPLRQALSARVRE
jgi:hypothetical protein